MKRRNFLKASVMAGAVTTIPVARANAEDPLIPAQGQLVEEVGMYPFPGTGSENRFYAKGGLPDLAPAEWIWCPTTRVHMNTFVLFRKQVDITRAVRRATGWIVGESRYLLEVNGERIQWGPAPSDPRFTEADPLDLTRHLVSGQNVIGATVCFFGGHGDGTWPTGKPGFLFWMEIEYQDGTIDKVVSDESWDSHLCRAWTPGHFRRHLMRALQEEFDARLYPYGWNTAGYKTGDSWYPAMLLGGSPNRTATFTDFFDIDSWIRATGESELRPRSIPLLNEVPIPVKGLPESYEIEWFRPPREYLEHLASTQSKLRNKIKAPKSLDAYRAKGSARLQQLSHTSWEVKLDGVHSAALTFEIPEQVVGFPYFTIEAKAGTVVEVLTQEGHEVGNAVLLQTGKNEWSRFICREGKNTFRCFEYDTMRWVQLHIYGTEGRVKISDVGVLRRIYPWPQAPIVKTSEPELQRLLDACLNTLNNNCQDIVVDGMGRERQQYCGDVAHQVHGVRMALGDYQLPSRYIKTFSQGMTTSGYFLDCWPAVDRLARAGQRHFNLFHFGTILDHGIQLFHEFWHHYMHTGETEAIREAYPRILRFANFLYTTIEPDGLLAVENLGMPFVWMDYEAYHQRSGEFPPFTQRRKQCAYNLYVAGAFRHSLAPICRLFGDEKQARSLEKFSVELEKITVKRFWSKEKRVFIDNLPWLDEEKVESYSDRALANAILYDQCPGGDIGPSVEMLATRPKELGISYVANAGWRFWALCKGGRSDIVLKEFRETWAKSRSVIENNSMPEGLNPRPDTGGQWSFCAVAPLYVTYQGLAGIRPLLPGYKKVEFRPQTGDLKDLELITHTPGGPVRFSVTGETGSRNLSVDLPTGIEGEILLRKEEQVNLKIAPGPAPTGYVRYHLPGGKTTSVYLKNS